MKPVETTRMRVSAEEMLLAAMEGATYTYSRVEADPESPKTHNTVIEFVETPTELAESIKNSPELRNRLGKISGENNEYRTTRTIPSAPGSMERRTTIRV